MLLMNLKRLVSFGTGCQVEKDTLLALVFLCALLNSAKRLITVKLYKRLIIDAS